MQSNTVVRYFTVLVQSGQGKKGLEMAYYALFYDVVDDFVEQPHLPLQKTIPMCATAW
jgi:hypothetical protein